MRKVYILYWNSLSRILMRLPQLKKYYLTILSKPETEKPEKPDEPLPKKPLHLTFGVGIV
jgi:hypothetical protein